MDAATSTARRRLSSRPAFAIRRFSRPETTLGGRFTFPGTSMTVKLGTSKSVSSAATLASARKAAND